VPSILTLTTDFGLRDGYVGAMKGVLMRLAPDVTLVDITHEIAAHDVMQAAFVLAQAFPFFPPGTVHLVVVDPGVGTTRRALAMRLGEQVFVGPDNGLFSLLPGGGEPEEVVVLDRPEVWRVTEPSATFHGRDIFAPVAARLAAGAALSDVGSPAEDIRRMHWPHPLADDQGLRGYVVHVDRFGNAITNIPAALLQEHRRGRPVKCYAGSTILDAVHATYGDVDAGEPLLLASSAGYLEIGVNGGNAARLLSLGTGSPVNIVFLDRR
jgi:S-adenosyl-L-methionine hydrolase (adenosine-forming)